MSMEVKLDYAKQEIRQMIGMEDKMKDVYERLEKLKR